MKTILLASGAALLASAVPAFAQDANSSTPSFTGGRAEIFGGWDRTRQRSRFDGVTDHAHKDGITGGVQLGYDFPLGDRIVAGPLASYQITSTKDCIGGVGCVKSGRQLEGGARVGYKLGDKALVYAKGAYVNGQFNAHAVDYSGDEPVYLVGHAKRDGWRAGAGAEYALNAHTYVKAEYDYTKFSRFNLDDGTSGLTDVRLDRNEVLGGFGIRF
jgi:outer membrane immunogenic protein